MSKVKALPDLRFDCLRLYYWSQDWHKAGTKMDEQYAKLLTQVEKMSKQLQRHKGVTS